MISEVLISGVQSFSYFLFTLIYFNFLFTIILFKQYCMYFSYAICYYITYSCFVFVFFKYHCFTLEALVAGRVGNDEAAAGLAKESISC